MSRACFVRSVQEELPYDPDAATGLPEVLRTGKTELYPYIPDELLVETKKSDPPEGLLDALRQLGHKVTPVEDTGDGRTPFGNVQALHVDISSGLITGVSDPRGEGRPRGF